ncbi:peptidoglycan/LPS O-acetylase OafA/YrhL [Rhizobium sp. ERR 922]|uniref:acyltransferase family protein n=1 Tax=unclassified Rhizobium TaxID=2613769 RepID=UPI0011A54736|nr:MULTISPECIES: acyltransferase [unclassified Rhizobium]TWB51684.1 peptidoglycan/LPS O-acetylase OafA/YrhL [Rhizobium sp. ERR 922]TWB94106.1 peptidoglycan/LPS O-acetylase OafA/YrhL [Rhizobium sp. ERR 942]
MKNATRRFGFFDGLRGLASVNVAISHFVVAFDFAIYTGKIENSHGSWDVTLSAFPFLFAGAGANFSVCIFLALSGYVLARSFYQSPLSFPQLVFKRTIRLGLPVLAASIFGWSLLKSGLVFNQEIAGITRSGWLGAQFRQADPAFADALLQAFNSLLGSVTLQNSYDAVLWTMPIEFLGSIVLISAFSAGASRLNRTGAAMLMLALGLIAGRSYISIMFFGAALYLGQIERLSERLKWRSPLLVLICIAGTVPFSQARGAFWDAMVSAMEIVPTINWPLPGFNNQGDVSLWHEVAAIALIFVLSGWRRAHDVLSTPFFLFLGRLSFPLYLAHSLALFSVACLAFRMAHSGGANYGLAASLAFLAYVPTALIFALAMEWLVDRPAIQLAAMISRRSTPNDGIAKGDHKVPPPTPLAR